ncbi:MAG: phytochelatin synthase family protein, partial [Desulfosarcinaceae bacterium]
MTLIRQLMFGGMYLAYGYSRLLGIGPFGRSRPVYLDATPLQKASDNAAVSGNRLKAALHRHHVRQYHEASCSVASVATVLNAIRASSDTDEAPITQLELLERVSCGHWKQRMQPEGHNGRRGLPLPLLGAVTAASLKAYGIHPQKVDVVPTTDRRTAAARSRLRCRLTRFETHGDCLILAHFNQGALVPALSIPHISPVGGYDPAGDRVLLLDVDPDQPAPYSVTFDRFFRALSCDYLG